MPAKKCMESSIYPTPATVKIQSITDTHGCIPIYVLKPLRERKAFVPLSPHKTGLVYQGFKNPLPHSIYWHNKIPHPLLASPKVSANYNVSAIHCMYRTYHLRIE